MYSTEHNILLCHSSDDVLFKIILLLVLFRQTAQDSWKYTIKTIGCKFTVYYKMYNNWLQIF